MKLEGASRWGVPLAIALAVVATFAPALRCDFTNWDDDVNFTKNPNYRGLSPARLAWMFTDYNGHYMPLTWITLGLDYALWGMDPAGYHLTSVLFHAANAVLFYLVLLRLMRRAAPATSEMRLRGAAAAGALFFALHPLRVESVAWVTERRDVVSGLFFLLSILAWLRAVDEPEGRRRLRWLAASVGLFVGSTLSKAMGMALPFVLLALDAYPLRRLTLKAVAEKIPYAAVMLLAIGLTALGQEKAEALRAAADYSTVDRALQPGYRALFYVGKTALPVGLAPIYLFEPAGRPVEAKYVLCLLGAAGVTAALFLARRRWPAGWAAWFAYGALLAPVIGLVQAGPHFAADRYTYLACLPWAALAAGAVRVARPGPAAAAAGAALAAVALLSWRHTGTWKDSMTLWNHAIAVDPGVYLSWSNRGAARMARGDAEGAVADYTEAIRLNPSFAKAWSNRGSAQATRKRWDEAISDCSEALKLRPAYAEALNNRGVARAGQGDLAGAIADYTEALRLNPGYADAYGSRGMSRQAAGDRAGAVADFESALRCAPPDWPHREAVERALESARK
jgi:tetratricopeptide (TPR) repeat protein